MSKCPILTELWARDMLADPAKYYTDIAKHLICCDRHGCINMLDEWELHYDKYVSEARRSLK